MRSLIVAGCLLLAATTLPAADLFTVHVPVQLSRIHSSVVSVNLACRLYGTHPTTQQEVIYALKNAPVPLASGVYSGTITLIFRTEDLNQPGLTDPNLITAYDCNITFKMPDGMSYQPHPTSTGPVLGHAPGTAFLMHLPKASLK